MRRAPTTAYVLILALCSTTLTLSAARAQGDGSGPGQFVVRCKYSHTLPDDPIVFPGQPGASHLHDFFGNATTDAFSTQTSLLAGTTTCRTPSDTAAYWSPVPYLNGVKIEPPVMRIYYLGQANADVETIPPGLRIIGGNKAATSPEDNPNVRWFCGATKNVKTPRMDEPYDCRPYAGYGFVDGVVGIVDTPNCWDGTGLEPADVTYRESGSCPSGFPHVLPRLSQRVHFGVMDPLNPDGSIALTLSSGPFYTLHADFWNAWQQSRLDQLVASCLDAHVHCGSIGVGQEIDWTREFGTAGADLVAGAGVSAGGVFVAGSIGGDAFVRRYGASGSEVWTRRFGTPGEDRALAIAVGRTAVYVVGSTDGVLGGQTSAGGPDGFVRKYGPDGKVQWTRQFGTKQADEAQAVTVGSGGVYVAGFTDGLFQGQTRQGGRDAFLQRYDASGRELWTRQFGTPGTDEARGVAAGVDRVYAVGSTTGSFGGRTAGALDAFVRQYETDGSRRWTHQFGTLGDDVAGAVATRGAAVYVVGSTDGVLGGQTSAGGPDGFVRKYDPHGINLWVRQFGTAGADAATAIDVAASGLYVAGSTDGAFAGATNLGAADAFGAKYDGKGFELWVRQFGTASVDEGLGVAVDTAAAYVVGSTTGAFEGEPNLGQEDGFVTRLRFT